MIIIQISEKEKKILKSKRIYYIIDIEISIKKLNRKREKETYVQRTDKRTENNMCSGGKGRHCEVQNNARK